MSNVYTMIPKKPAQYNLLTKQERLVYVPLATRETAGIVKIGEGFVAGLNGELSIDPIILNNISNIQHKVDKVYDATTTYKLLQQNIYNDTNGIGMSSSTGTNGINFNSTLTKSLDIKSGQFQYFKNIRNNGNSSTKITNIKFVDDGDGSYIEYNKTGDEFNGEIVTRPYVDAKDELVKGYADAKDELVKGYVDNKVTEIKKSVGYVFDTFINFVSWIDGSYTRHDGVTVNDLNVGDDIFIAEEGIPDYWVKSKSNPMTIADFAPYESGDYKPTITWLEG